MRRPRISSVEIQAILNMRRRKLLEEEEEEEPEDIFERHTWALAYDSQDLSGASWPASALSTITGASGCTLTAVGTHATTGVSTTGLTAEAIGASRVDKAVQQNGASQWYAATNMTPNFATDGIWSVRYLFRSGWTTGTEAHWQFDSNTGTAMFRIRQTSEANLALGYTSTFVQSVGGHANSTWYLLDYIMSPTGGTGGVARMTVYRNGVALGPYDDDAASTSIAMNGTADPEFLMQPGSYFVFWGVKFSDHITLEQHQQDAEDLGLYTP